MSAQKYLLIESRDPFDAADVPYFFDLARELAGQGEEVILYIIQNGVLGLRKQARASVLSEWIEPAPTKSLRILGDDFSLRERGIRPEELIPGVEISNVDALVDFLLEEKRKAIWH